MPVGELEGWWPEGPTTKRDWIDQALTQAASGALTSATAFMTEVLSFVEPIERSDPASAVGDA